MTRILIPLLLLAATQVKAQKDFDYTFYTMKADWTKDTSKQPLHLTLPRKIHKDANVIKIISLTNTGDAQTLNVLFVGYDFPTRSLIYTLGAPATMIIVNPLEATLTIRYQDGTKEEYH